MTADPRSDADLLGAHVAGDPLAFETLVRRHRDRLWAVALRTTGDPLVDTFQRLLASGIVEERVRLYSLPVFQRWLARPEEFRTHLRTVIPAGAPVYLTIDLDVLSSDAIAGQLSTPAGPGLDWHQLLETTVLVCDEFDVVGADVVEFNPDHKNRAVHDEREMTVLLLELIDGLARARRRAIGER